MTRPISIRLDLVGPLAGQQAETPPRRRAGRPPRDGVPRVHMSLRMLPETAARLRAAAERDGVGAGVVVDRLAQLLPDAAPPAACARR